MIGKSPWRWVIAAGGLVFVGLELPVLFSPLPDYAQRDGFEFFMFYAVPAIVIAIGLGFAYFALRSGVFVDAGGVLIRPAAGVRSKRVPVEAIREVTVAPRSGSVVSSVSPALISVDGELIDLGLVGYGTSGGYERAESRAITISRVLDRPFRIV